MALHGLYLPGSNRYNCIIAVLCASLCKWIWWRSYSPSDTNGLTDGVLLCIFCYKWMMLTFQEIWTRKFLFDVPFMPQFEWRDGILLVCSIAFISSVWIPPPVPDVHLYLTWPHIVKKLFRLNKHKSARCSFLPSFYCFWGVNYFLSSVE